mmetsp:Transcript_128541/g.363787  ORF Transcript_128541/g.363787 Transcript_128541/m.363787 type:complete len:204 (-) Transcript_128541:1712-2323(-)
MLYAADKAYNTGVHHPRDAAGEHRGDYGHQQQRRRRGHQPRRPAAETPQAHGAGYAGRVGSVGPRRRAGCLPRVPGGQEQPPGREGDGEDRRGARRGGAFRHRRGEGPVIDEKRGAVARAAAAGPAPEEPREHVDERPEVLRGHGERPLDVVVGLRGHREARRGRDAPHRDGGPAGERPGDEVPRPAKGCGHLLHGAVPQPGA